MIKKLKIIIPIMILLLFCFGFLFAPNDPFKVDMTARFSGATADFPLGKDTLGRCILSQLLYGGTATVGIVLLGGITVCLFGVPIGLLIARDESKEHLVFDSFINAFTAIPPIAYLIIFIGAWGNGITTMLIAVTVSLFLRLIKIVRARTEVELGKAYVLCAYTSGVSKLSTECENKGVSDKLDDENKPTNRVPRSRGITAK